MVEHLIDDGKPGREHPYTSEEMGILERLRDLLEADLRAQQQQEHDQE